MPGATTMIQDKWDVLLREFVQNNSLDLRGKEL